METIFYILIYLTAVCYPSYDSITLTSNDAIFNNNLYQQQCDKSEANVQIVNSIDNIIEYKNKSLGQIAYIYEKEPDKIIKVTVKDGVISQKEVRIVPVRQTTKKMVEQEETKIIKYQIE